jgi:DNA-binding CsgD family transcriptional regulator
MTARAVAWTLGLERVLIRRLASGQHALLPVAAARGLSTFTVRDHISNLLRKLQVGSRSAALVKAQELRLLRNAGGPQ